MIRWLTLANFKAVGDAVVRIETAPVTLLVGPNGSGKSSILEALAVLSESAAAQNRLGLTVDGDRVAFPSIDQAFHRCDVGRTLRLGVTVSTHPGEEVVSYAMEARQHGTGNRWYYSQSVKVFEAGVGVRASAGATCQREIADDDHVLDVLTLAVTGWSGPSSGADHILQPRAFDPTGLNPDRAAASEGARVVAAVRRLGHFLANDVVVIGGERGASFFVREVGPAALRTGRFGEATIRLVSIVKADAKRHAAWNRIARWAAEFGMPGLTGGWIGSNELVATFLDPGTDAQLPLTSAAGGSQRLLPLLIDAFASASSRTLVIDEIDAGLHPEWQVRLADLLADIATAGNQVVATTHSPTTVLAVCAAVAAGKLRSEDVAIYGFERTDEVRATRLPVTRSGAIEGGWIESFAKVESQLLGSFLRGTENEEPAAVGPAEGRRRRGGHGRVSESPPVAPQAGATRKRSAQRRRAPRR